MHGVRAEERIPRAEFFTPSKDEVVGDDVNDALLAESVTYFGVKYSRGGAATTSG